MAMAWVKRQDFTGCPIRCFNVVIGTLSLNNSFCSFSILFGYSSTSHHPVITTIKCQFLRGQLLTISCILRVQYVCLRFMHLYFTSWPKKEVKPLSYTGGVNAFEVRFFVHPSCIWVLLQSAHLPLLWFSCLLAIAGWYNLNINCNQNIHYTNKLSYLHFLGSCVGGGGIFFT